MTTTPCADRASCNRPNLDRLRFDRFISASLLQLPGVRQSDMRYFVMAWLAVLPPSEVTEVVSLKRKAPSQPWGIQFDDRLSELGSLAVSVVDEKGSAL